jgi:hypothetical protein
MVRRDGPDHTSSIIIFPGEAFSSIYNTPDASAIRAGEKGRIYWTMVSSIPWYWSALFALHDLPWPSRACVVE